MNNRSQPADIFNFLLKNQSRSTRSFMIRLTVTDNITSALRAGFLADRQAAVSCYGVSVFVYLSAGCADQKSRHHNNGRAVCVSQIVLCG